MGRRLHLTRTGGAISQDDWRTALADTPGVRLNRRTADTSDAELYDPQSKVWVPMFALADGRVSFPEVPGVHAMGHALRDAATHLARLLHARVLDDQGNPTPWSP